MQTKKQSLIETLSNVGTGFVTTLLLSPPIYWIAGVTVKYSQMWVVTVLFTIASVLRGYVIRRWFNKNETIIQSAIVEFPICTSNPTSATSSNVSVGVSDQSTGMTDIDLEFLNSMKERDRTPKFKELQRASLIKSIAELKANYFNPNEIEKGLLDKWSFALEKNNSNTPDLFIAKYAEQHSVIESLCDLNSSVKSSLSLALRVLVSVDFKGLLPLLAEQPVLNLPNGKFIEVKTHVIRMSSSIEEMLLFSDENIFTDLLISETQKIIDKAVEEGDQLFYAYHMFCLMSDEHNNGQNKKSAFSRFTTAKV